MYLFTRLATLRGNERRAMGWAVEMAAYANDHSDHTVTLWRADFGYPVGTVAWSAWVESQDALNKGFARLAEDDGYFDMVDKGQEFIVEPPYDMLRQSINGDPAGDPPPPGPSPRWSPRWWPTASTPRPVPGASRWRSWCSR